MGQAMTDDLPDFTRLDDSALLSSRAQMRAELERLPSASPGHAALSAAYDRSTEELDNRARAAWSRAAAMAGNPGGRPRAGLAGNRGRRQPKEGSR
jgi:hypothetical protein